jgi:hypothetical protein
MSDFFHELGQKVCQELSAPSGKFPAAPAARAHLQKILGNTLDTHLTEPPAMAKDSVIMTPYQRLAHDQAGYPNDQDPDDPAEVTMSGDDCLELVRLCAQKLAGSERDAFMQGLAEIISPEEGPSSSNGIGDRRARDQGLPQNNLSAVDRRRAGARDTRRPAQDAAVRALNSASFARRFPMAANIKVLG